MGLGSRARAATLAAIAACAGTALLAPSASATGSAQGPPAGPKSAPFTQCPAIGKDTSCEYLIDVTSTNPTVPPTVVQDAHQSFFDGEDDVTVAVQNDTKAPLGSIHIGVAGSNDHLFAFDGDGLCWSLISPKPAECPFSQVSYDGPDTTLSAESPDAGTVFFNTPLAPGQYTYFALEAALKEGLVAGEVDDVVSTTLTDAETPEGTDALSAPAPVAVTDQATIKGVHGAEATGTVEYILYKDSSCHVVAETLGTKNVLAGVAEASEPSSSALATNATYYWVAKYSGDSKHFDSPNSSACGSETMTFGTPKALPQPSLSTVLSGAGELGSHITVGEGTSVRDTAVITAPEGLPVSGRVTYAVFTNPLCIGESVAGVAGGGATSGLGPSTNPLTLPAGTYYFQAYYSGSPVLRSASTLCGEEVLSVLAKPAPAQKVSGSRASSSSAAPAVTFNLLGVHVDTKSGQISLRVQSSAAGTITAAGIVQQGATMARSQTPLAGQAQRKCKRGFLTKRGKCTSNAPALYGTAALTSSTPGTFTIVIKPARRALQALRKGRSLDVTLSASFQARAGGAPIRHARHAFVWLKRPKHKRH